MKTNRPVYAGDPKELELVAQEILDVKNYLRELSRQLIRIERLIKAALPPDEKRATPTPRQELKRDGACQMIDRLKERAIEGLQIEDELRRMTVKNELVPLARELGLTNAKLPPKDELVGLIATRLRQGAIVARGFRETFEEARARPRSG